MHGYVNKLYYIPTNSAIGIRLDSDKTHRNTANRMVNDANKVKDMYIKGIYRPYDEVSSIIGTNKKLEELVNYYFDLRTTVVASDIHLNDKTKSCDLFNDFLNHSEGFISKINDVLDKTRINHTMVEYEGFNNKEGYHDIRYHIIDNIDFRIIIQYPTKSDGVTSDRFSNCMRFIVSLYIAGSIDF